MVRTLALMLFVVHASAVYAQDAAVLDTLQKSLGRPLPSSLRVTAAGSAYVPGAGDAGERQHMRLQALSQELDLAAPRFSETAVIVDTRAGAKEPARKTSRVAGADSPWTDQYALWTTPAGFLAGAAARSPRVGTETLFGRSYRVVTLTTPSGHDVRGYVNEENVLERTRTEIEQQGGKKVAYEAIYLDWTDFDGLKYPSLIIQKENDELARILIVDKVAAEGGAAPSAATH